MRFGSTWRASALCEVISRTSSMYYRGSGKPLPEVARQMNVDAVVEARSCVPATGCASRWS